MLLLPAEEPADAVRFAESLRHLLQRVRTTSFARRLRRKDSVRAGTAIFRIPDSLSTEAVVGAGCALTTAIHGIERAPVAWGMSS